MSEIKQVTITTRQPIGDGDPGRVEIGFYKITKSMIAMCDEDGRPTGKRLALGPGDDPKRIASKLLREQSLRRGGESDFNRPLNYPRSGVA
ncbi:hypothetical protein [Bradyrhizobium sp.]|uniref:hypothetical protein n=1 Tax=Bradyrhizobium sp. TaxID=376 RepID=UPI003BAF8C0A